MVQNYGELLNAIKNAKGINGFKCRIRIQTENSRDEFGGKISFEFCGAIEISEIGNGITMTNEVKVCQSL